MRNALNPALALLLLVGCGPGSSTPDEDTGLSESEVEALCEEACSCFGHFNATDAYENIGNCLLECEAQESLIREEGLDCYDDWQASWECRAALVDDECEEWPDGPEGSDPRCRDIHTIVLNCYL